MTIVAVLSVSALLGDVSAAVSSPLTLISSKDSTAGVTTLSGNMPDGGFVVACGVRYAGNGEGGVMQCHAVGVKSRLQSGCHNTLGKHA